MKDYRHLYSRFLGAHPGEQHFASHSHHYWPDVTLEAHIEYWQDSCQYVDKKWDYFFSQKIPKAQKLIAENLGFSKPSQIVFAPNTHELTSRILSCFPSSRKFRVLTTDSEFYSFERQISRLEEAEACEVVRVPTEPFTTFEARFCAEASQAEFDLVFFSEVFFNSGVAVQNTAALVSAVKNPECLVVVDGYHSFMALPTRWSALEKRVFYIAGSYKYAQGGEGCCFMWVPPDCALRPQNTGWFASFGTLASYDRKVQYSSDGFRFAGSTMDYSALYRLIAVLELFKEEGLRPENIHTQIQWLQSHFLKALTEQNHEVLNTKRLLVQSLSHHGHFLTFRCDSSEQCEKLSAALAHEKILTDYRGDRLRFGFGLYHDPDYKLEVLSLPKLKSFS